MFSPTFFLAQGVHDPPIRCQGLVPKVFYVSIDVFQSRAMGYNKTLDTGIQLSVFLTNYNNCNDPSSQRQSSQYTIQV